MARKKSIWVKPSGDVWVAQQEGAAKDSEIRNTQKEAYEAARNIALNQNLNITVCSPNGKIQRVVTPREARDNNCFITTACVSYYGLPDNCYQLITLRKFRDTYLSVSKANKDLVNQYYSVAPRLVELLETDKDKSKLYQQIFERINKACNEIEHRNYSEAKAVYQNAVLYLFNHFKDTF